MAATSRAPNRSGRHPAAAAARDGAVAGLPGRPDRRGGVRPVRHHPQELRDDLELLTMYVGIPPYTPDQFFDLSVEGDRVPSLG